MTVYNLDNIQGCEDSFYCSICSTSIKEGQWLYSKVQRSFAILVRKKLVTGNILEDIDDDNDYDSDKDSCAISEWIMF